MEEPFCVHCGKPLRDCTQEYCTDCRTKKSWVAQGRALWLHREPVPGAIYRFKYRNRRSYAKVFAREMEKYYGSWIRKREIGVMIPVPLHAARRRHRGYNQAELLAEELSVLTGIPVEKKALFRIRNTIPQKSLDTGERKKNLQGAFAVSGRWKPVKNVLLIDDIYTTGSTIEHAARVMHRAGAENVYFLTISIGQGI